MKKVIFPASLQSSSLGRYFVQFAVLAIIMLPEMIACCRSAGSSLNPAMLWAPEVKDKNQESRAMSVPSLLEPRG